MVRPGLLSYQAHLHNFTNTGLGLAVQQPFDPGTVLAIQLRIAKTGLSCVLSATVVRCQQEATGDWFLGCKLSRPLNDEETRALF
jgi:PilZ domain